MKKFIIIVSFFIFNYTNAQVSGFKNVDFTNAENTAKLNQGESLKNMSLLSYNLTSELSTDAEKFRAIYTWVCNNIRSDASQYKKVIRKQKKYKNDTLAFIEWSNKYKKVVYKKLLKQKKTMCTGYAYLVKELAFLADIECVIVDGYGRTVEANVDSLEIANHSWNAVKLDNKWYLCDATWSSGYLIESKGFVKDYNDGYFLTSPTLFSNNHFPKNKQWLLDSSTTESSFVAAPLVYGEAFKQGVFPEIPATMNFEIQKNEEISFSFKTLNKVATDKITLLNYSGGTENAYDIYDINNDNGVITFKNKFKYRGSYDVHLKIGEDIVATYIINVVKN